MSGITTSIVNWFQGIGLPKEIVAFIVSMLPIVELRGGLPVASVLGIPYFKALGICVLGNPYR